MVPTSSALAGRAVPGVTDRKLLRAVQAARALGAVLEGGLIALTAFSALAFGAVHPWAYVPLWLSCGAVGALFAVRAKLILFLRRRLGPCRVAVDHDRHALLLDPGRAISGALDLDTPPLRAAPLFLPGLVFAVLVIVQLLPRWRSGTPLTTDGEDTLRGLAFVASLGLLHVAAAALFVRHASRDRYRGALVILGTLLALIALVQSAAGTRRIYGFFTPEDGDSGIFGPFVNRNSFAGYMLMVVPICLQRLVRAVRSTAGAEVGLRRRLSALSVAKPSPVLATVPVLVTVASLVATRSRGALVALVVAFLLGGLVGAGWRRRWSWAVPLPFLLAALAWAGPERLHARLARTAADSPGRVAIWADALRRLDGRWLMGTGFNTFAASMSRVPAWSLPRGASAWPPELDTRPEARPGFRALAELPWLTWYREAHNDYLQLFVETGVAGLAIGLWAGLRVLRRLRSRRWLFMAAAGLLGHVFVDFDMQIPAVALLFVALCAMAPREASAAGGRLARWTVAISRRLARPPLPGGSG